jgi:hypothetical protein
VRVRIGRFWLGDLPPGQWRELTPAEIKLVHSDEVAPKQPSPPSFPTMNR